MDLKMKLSMGAVIVFASFTRSARGLLVFKKLCSTSLLVRSQSKEVWQNVFSAGDSRSVSKDLRPLYLCPITRSSRPSRDNMIAARPQVLSFPPPETAGILGPE